ncbi:MAG: hypothetical protein A2W31_07385 [Planctomycetes bacterium RBG_16_64_10]|nr:MAG: hypothetical protein A2W31_07385 [Planctomycetes bacterium RBG_16_64_10]
MPLEPVAAQPSDRAWIDRHTLSADSPRWQEMNLRPADMTGGIVRTAFGLIAVASVTSAAQVPTVQRCQDFLSDPRWQGVNHLPAQSAGVAKVQDFGYRNTAFAGGGPGEIGGLVWRIESVHPEQAFAYGTPIGRLSLKEALTASGKIALRNAAADSAILLGWYNSHTAIGAPPSNFVGALLEGPSRAGHYFRIYLDDLEYTVQDGAPNQ